MSCFGNNTKFIFIFVLFILNNSCVSKTNLNTAADSNTRNLMIEKNETDKEININKEAPSSISPYAQNRINKIIQNFEANKLSSSDADEAFLLGKIFEEKRNYFIAEKLYTASFYTNKTLICGINLTNTLINLKKNEKALEIALKLEVLFPQKPDIEILIASVYQLNGDYNSLIKTLEKAYKKYPNNEAIVIFYASNIKNNKKRILENFLSKNPKSTNVMLALAQKYYTEKNNMSALKYAKNAYLLDSDNIEIITIIAKIEQNLKNYAEAEKYFKLAFEKESDNNLNAQNYVNILLYQKKLQEALSILLKLEASSDEHIPFPPEFSFQISKILIVNKDFKGASKRLLELSKEKYNNSVIMYYLAICSEGQRKFNEAIDYLNKITQESELYHDSKKAKILIYINSNNKEEAEKNIKNFEISESNIAEDTIFKANILAFYLHYKEAIEIINSSLKKIPDAKELYLKKAEYLRFAESEEASLQFAEQIYTKWPNYGDGLNFLGYTLVERNQKIEYARKILHKAVMINPKNGFYLDSLGWLYFQKNDLKNSLKYIQEALKFEPDEPVIIYHLALVQLKEQQFEKSLKNLEMTSKILSDMLPYQLESDPELGKISKGIGSKIMEIKKLIETQKKT